MSMPRRRAIEERTWSRSSFSPSISLDLMTSSVRLCSDGLAAELKAEGLHAADQPALPWRTAARRLGQSFLAPAEMRPCLALIDVGRHCQISA